MPRYEITSTTGVESWGIYETPTIEDALDAMATEFGFDDYGDLCMEIGSDGLSVLVLDSGSAAPEEVLRVVLPKSKET